MRGDAADYESLVSALRGVDVAFYLIHSMEGSASRWERFVERDRRMAENFARASTECGVKRIVYLGGLVHGDDQEVSRHMRSRREVGDILKTSTARVTIFRAAVVIGQGSASFRMLSQLVDRLPIMVCPKWVYTRVQPISVEDVVAYLSQSLETDSTVGREYDVGGPDVLTYMDLMGLYARKAGKRFRSLRIPFLSLRLSSYWVDLVTDVPASLARPLVESLAKEAVASEDSIERAIPVRLKTCEEAVERAIAERAPPRRLSRSAKALVALLPVLAALGVFSPALAELLQGRAPLLAALLAVWLLGVGLSIYFTSRGARLGGLVGGLAAWLFVIFWALRLLGPTFGGAPISLDEASALGYAARMSAAAITAAAAHWTFHQRRGA